MKIGKNNRFSNNISSDKINIEVGKIIDGKIVKKSDDKIIIQLKDNTFMTGEIKIPLNNYNDKNFKFLIKSIKNNKIVLSIIEENNKLDTEYIIKSEYSSIGTKLNKTQKNILLNMVKFNLEVNNNTIDLIYKTINKIYSILSSKDDVFASINKNENIMHEDLKNIIRNSDIDINENKEFDFKKILNSNINIKKIINDLMHTNNEDSIINKLVFLYKNNFKFSVNNIKILHELEINTFLNKDLNNILSWLFKENLLSNKESLIVKEFLNKLDINTIINNKNDLSSFDSEFNKILSIINSKINTKKENNEILDSFNNIKDKIGFINKLNDNILFQYIPLNTENDEDKLLIFKNKEKKNENSDKNNIKLMISINTKKMKKIDVLCEYNKKNDDIKINIITKEYIEQKFIEKNIEKLYETLNSIGFNNVLININKEVNNSLTIVDLSFEENVSKLNIDIRV